jgi:hypothetical protein
MGAVPSWGQIRERERDVTITGPRGHTIQRSIRSERGPGFIDRQVNIQRPGGSFHSEAAAARIPRMPGPPAGRGFGPPHHWGGGFGPRGPVVVERDVVVNRGLGVGPALAIGGGLFGLGLFAGSALASPPPPPVYVAPAPPPVVVYNAPQPYSAAPPPPATVVVDPVANAAGRLQSYHANSRREGAYTLGRLRDPRALPPLMDRLKNDYNTDVRVAAATALGEIGDPRGAVALERASVYDKKQVVRDAASQALSRLPREMPATVQPGLAAPATVAPAGGIPAQGPVGGVPVQGPTTGIPAQAPIEDAPPPPPTPAFPSSEGFSDRP